jgi:hypothetical protein
MFTGLHRRTEEREATGSDDLLLLPFFVSPVRSVNDPGTQVSAMFTGLHRRTEEREATGSDDLLLLPFFVSPVRSVNDSGTQVFSDVHWSSQENGRRRRPQDLMISYCSLSSFLL